MRTHGLGRAKVWPSQNAVEGLELRQWLGRPEPVAVGRDGKEALESQASVEGGIPQVVLCAAELEVAAGVELLLLAALDLKELQQQSERFGVRRQAGIAKAPAGTRAKVAVGADTVGVVCRGRQQLAAWRGRIA